MTQLLEILEEMSENLSQSSLRALSESNRVKLRQAN
jgi:hypothetical protein